MTNAAVEPQQLLLSAPLMAFDFAPKEKHALWAVDALSCAALNHWLKKMKKLTCYL